MLKIEFKAMGCQMEAIVDTDEPRARRALEAVPAWFEEWEQALSRFRDGSELSRLNRRAGSPVCVGTTLFEVTRLALQAAACSDGLVTPLILNAVEAAGYTRSLEGPDRFAVAGNAGRNQVSAPSSVADWRTVQLDRARRKITLPAGARLDVAGVAKGWAAAHAARRLARFGPAFVSASGDIAVSGPRADGTPWPIGIENPFGRDEDMPLLMLSHHAVATSSRAYRRWQRNGRWQHHIIDPRTGEPARTDVLAVTAVAPTAVEAEAAAKAVMILGSGEGMDWLEKREFLAGLLVLETGEVLRSSSFREYTWE